MSNLTLEKLKVSKACFYATNSEQGNQDHVHCSFLYYRLNQLIMAGTTNILDVFREHPFFKPWINF